MDACDALGNHDSALSWHTTNGTEVEIVRDTGRGILKGVTHVMGVHECMCLRKQDSALL